jgi:Flp pilus assembly protein TadG
LGASWLTSAKRRVLEKLRDDRGQILVLTVLSMTAIMGFLALAIDVGQILYVKRQLQTVADAAALAGALELKQCGSTANCTVMQTAVQSAVAENGLSGYTFLTQCSGTPGATYTVMLNNGPCRQGASDPNNGNVAYVEALVAKQQDTMFAKLLGVNTISLVARAESGLGPLSGCVYVTNATASQALLLNGNASLITSSTCGTIVNSSSSSALLANGSATLTSEEIDVHGGDLLNGKPSLSPTPRLGTPVQPDPLAGLPAPTVSGCTYSNVTVNSGKTATTLNPGTYCGLNINGNATVTFTPGTYIMNGNVTINGGSTISGSNVFFYINSGQWLMNGNSSADLVASTTGTYAGVLFYQSTSDTNQFILNGDSTSIWQGAIYLPKGQLVVNGNGNLAAYTLVDVDTMIVNGSDSFTVGNDFSSFPNGSPFTGNTAYLME